MPKGSIARSWLTTLRQHVESKPCVLLRREDADPHAYIGIVSSRNAIITRDIRIKVKHAVRVEPATEQGLLTLLGTGPHAGQLLKKLELAAPVIVLSPKLSSALIDSMVALPANQGPMRTRAERMPEKNSGDVRSVQSVVAY